MAAAACAAAARYKNALPPGRAASAAALPGHYDTRSVVSHDSIPRQERQEAAERLQSAEEKFPGMEFCISIALGACKGICTEKADVKKYFDKFQKTGRMEGGRLCSTGRERHQGTFAA